MPINFIIGDMKFDDDLAMPEIIGHKIDWSLISVFDCNSSRPREACMCE